MELSDKFTLLDETLTELSTKFAPLDEIFSNTSSLGDDKVLEILNEHRKLEARYVTDKLHLEPLETGFLGEYFHKENIITIDYIIENIDIAHLKMDALIYLYPFLIHRYSKDGGELLPTVEKFNNYFTTLQLVFNTNNLNITYIGSTLTRFFYSRSNHIYLNEFIELIISASGNNWMYAFQYCRVLLYDKEFCFSFYPYEGTMHSGAYILFDTVLYKILTGRSSYRQNWIEKQVDFFEKNKEIQFSSMPEYYLMVAQLSKCRYLSLDKKDGDAELNAYFESIKLPDFEIGENFQHLYSLYIQKLNCLENFNKTEKILEICDYLLRAFIESDKERYTYYIGRINWRKYNALKCTDNKKHIAWYFEIMSINTVEKIKNNVYLSPFMTQDTSNRDLYHFTDLEALKSIVEKNTLWLTRYDFLNDTKEIKYVTEIFKNNIEVFLDKGFKAFIGECLELLDAYFDDRPDGAILSAIKNCISNVYVLSTSTKEDNLSLWHYYSGGTGCSIRINTEELLNNIECRNTSVINKEAQVFKREIEYTNDFPKSGLIETLQTIYTNDTLGMDKRKFLACVHIIYEGIFTKNPNMSQEEEFRVVVIAGNESEFENNKLTSKFRVSKNTFIPYIELSIESQTLIKEICIAPLNKTDIAKKGLKEFLKSMKFDVSPKRVKVSEIELRY